LSCAILHSAIEHRNSSRKRRASNVLGEASLVPVREHNRINLKFLRTNFLVGSIS
jgi:hypothetical protein